MLIKHSAADYDTAWTTIAQPGSGLLDNWYFLDPINQRGQTVYDGAVYGIDRWKNRSAHVRSSIEVDGITISRIPGSSANSTRNITQIVEDSRSLAGRTVTISALVSRCSPSAMIILNNGDTSLGSAYGVYSGDPFLLSKTIALPASLDDLNVQLRAASGDGDTSATFIAAKLELGDHQTLAHQDAAGNWVINDPPPNKTLELLKCQRYQVIYHFDTNGSSVGVLRNWRGSNNWYIYLTLPVAPYKTPAVTNTGGALSININLNDRPEVTNISYWSHVDTQMVLRVIAGNDTAQRQHRDTATLECYAPPAKLIVDMNL